MMTDSDTFFSRRTLLLSGAASVVLAACSGGDRSAVAGEVDADTFADSEFRSLSDEQWEARLDPISFAVLRQAKTERPYTSVLNNEDRDGKFHCAGCDLPIFKSDAKFDSGTGWPSFFDIVPGNVGTSTDYKIGYARTEYHCARCLGHQGHVFKDGPAPTGLRYCNNGAALSFVSA